jgi:hypothetical protein
MANHWGHDSQLLIENSTNNATEQGVDISLGHPAVLGAVGSWPVILGSLLVLSRKSGWLPWN